MNDLFLFLLCVLANYRLAEMITLEDGPFGVFLRWRLFLGSRSEKRYSVIWSLAELFHCAYCSGVWIALLIALLIERTPFWIWWLAIAGGQAAIKNYLSKDIDYASG